MLQVADTEVQNTAVGIKAVIAAVLGIQVGQVVNTDIAVIDIVAPDIAVIGIIIIQNI